MSAAAGPAALGVDVTCSPYEVPNDGSPASRAIQRALDEQPALFFPPGTYLLDAPLVVPARPSTVLRGAGFQLARFNVPPHSAGIVYRRAASDPGIVLCLESVTLCGLDPVASALGIVFHGRDGADNNWLRMRDCALYGFLAGVSLQNAGQCHFEAVWVQRNVIGWMLGRASNVVYFTNVMCLNNGRFLHLDDPLADGCTHGLTITNSHSLLGYGTDVKLVGGQAIFIAGSAFDLGQGGGEGLLLRRCQDVRIADSWVCAGREGRDGIAVEDCQRWSITGTTINNCAVGLRLKGPAEYPSAGSVSSCQFAANRTSDIVLLDDLTGMTIQGNQFTQDPATVFPHAPSARRRAIEVDGERCSHNVAVHNIFSGDAYSILRDRHSIASPNVWNMPGLLVKLDLAAMQRDVSAEFGGSFVDPDDARVQEIATRIVARL